MDGVGVKFDEILFRITGLSVPIFGVQWNPPEAECLIARRVLAFLEDRRVLYVPSEMEVPHYCVTSVLKIREFLTAELGMIDRQQEIAKNLLAMRADCRKFVSIVDADDGRIIRFGGEQGHCASWIFNGAVGELRGVFGVHIAQMAACYGLDVEGELSSILPGDDHE